MAGYDFITLTRTIAERTGQTTSAHLVGIKREITRAIQHYKDTPLGFNETQATLTTVSGTAEHVSGAGAANYPTDLRSITHAQITISGSLYDLEPVSIEKYRAWIGGTTSNGQPFAWTWYEDEFILYPTPGDSYVVTLDYIQHLSGPTTSEYSGTSWSFYDEDGAAVSDTSTSEWFNEAQDLIVARTERNLYTVQKDYIAAANARQEEREALAELRSRVNRQRGPILREAYL